MVSFKLRIILWLSQRSGAAYAGYSFWWNLALLALEMLKAIWKLAFFCQKSVCIYNFMHCKGNLRVSVKWRMYNILMYKILIEPVFCSDFSQITKLLRLCLSFAIFLVDIYSQEWNSCSTGYKWRWTTSFSLRRQRQLWDSLSSFSCLDTILLQWNLNCAYIYSVMPGIVAVMTEK